MLIINLVNQVEFVGSVSNNEQASRKERPVQFCKN